MYYGANEQTDHPTVISYCRLRTNRNNRVNTQKCCQDIETEYELFFHIP